VLGNDPVRVEEVPIGPRPREALLDYLVTRDRLIVFVVTRAGLNVVQREMASGTLTHRVRLLHDLWGAPSAGLEVGTRRGEGAG
jgi:hypothetical protein